MTEKKTTTTITIETNLHSVFFVFAFRRETNMNVHALTILLDEEFFFLCEQQIRNKAKDNEARKYLTHAV